MAHICHAMATEAGTLVQFGAQLLHLLRLLGEELLQRLKLGARTTGVSVHSVWRMAPRVVEPLALGWEDSASFPVSCCCPAVISRSFEASCA